MSKDASPLSAEDLWKKVCSRVAALVEKRSEPGRHAARSAIRHTERAAALADIDREMAVFRAITAEEEAATAIIRALQRAGYEGADRLDRRNHVHKAAIGAFLQAVGLCLDEAATRMGLALSYEVDDEPGDQVRTAVHAPAIAPGKFYPTPPFGFTITIDERPHHFRSELAQILRKVNPAKVADAIRDRANKRNRLLYAADTGVPTIATPVHGFLTRSHDIVFGNLLVYLIIDRSDEKQLLVQQALPALLDVLAEARSIRFE